MAFYEDWDSDWQAFFDDNSGTDARWERLDDNARGAAEFFFDLGFMNLDVDSSVRVEARENFFDIVGLDEADFNWAEWHDLLYGDG